MFRRTAKTGGQLARHSLSDSLFAVIGTGQGAQTAQKQSTPRNTVLGANPRPPQTRSMAPHAHNCWESVFEDFPPTEGLSALKTGYNWQFCECF